MEGVKFQALRRGQFSRVVDMCDLSRVPATARVLCFAGQGALIRVID